MKVLIVDDSGFERELLRYAIEKYGHETREAEDGVDGIQKAAIYKPDLIISDVFMPKMDGFQFLRRIKQDEALKSIPFVFYSAVYTGDRDIELIESLGASAFIVKPENPDEFLLKIKRLLEEGIKTEKKKVAKIQLEEDEAFLKNYSLVVVKKLEEKVKELETEIARRKLTEARQATQFTLSNIFSEYASLHAAAPRILQSICEGFGWVLGELWRVDRKSNVLRLESLWHVPALNARKFEELSYMTTFSPGVELPGRVWTNGQPATWVSDVRTDDNFLRSPIAGELGLHGAVAFPVRKTGSVIGAMVFFSKKILPLDKEILDVMADIGLRVGTFINRKLSEEQLRESERKYRLLFENLPQKIFLKDKNSVYVYCNENFAKELKIRADEIAGKSDYDFFPKELAEKHREVDRKVLASGKEEKFKERFVRDGNEVSVLTIKTPVKDEKGNVTGIVGILRGIPD